MPQPVYILFGWLLTAGAAFGLGRILIHRLKLPLYREEEIGFSFLLGSAVLSELVFALAAVHVVYKGLSLVCGVAAILGAWLIRPALPSLPALPRRWIYGFAPLAIVFGVLMFANAMAPEMSPDGSSYHLGLVAGTYRERGFSFLTTNMYANLSQGMEMLFLFAFAFGKHSAAAMTHLTFLFALVWLMSCYARRFGFPVAGVAASLFAFLSPVMGVDAASAYNDAAVAAVIFGIYYLMQIWEVRRSTALVVAAGVLCGFAYAIKYTAFVALPYAAGMLLWRRQWRAVLRLGAVSALWILPWMIKNSITVGNPVSPFANRLFPNPYVHVAFEEQYREHMRNYDGLRSHWDIPLEVTVRGSVLCGLVGPLFLLAPVALLAWRRRHGKQLLVAAAVFGIVYATNIGTRFLIPALPFVALAMAQAMARAPALLAILVLAHGIASWPDVLKTYCATYAWRLDRILWKQALRIESEDGFLERKWPAYSTARLIERATSPRAQILAWNQTGEAYTTRTLIIPYASAEGAVLGAIMWTPLVLEYQPTRRLAFHLPGSPVRRIRLRQTQAGAPDHFTVSELRVFLKGREVSRAPPWRLRAHPNPWDVRDAFDNSPVTRWSSWDRIRGDMFVEVDFGRDTPVDSVVAELSPDNAKVRVAVDWFDAAGRGTTVDKFTETEMVMPLGLRRESAEVLRSRGITHLLVHENDFGARDFQERGEDWGLVFLGERYGFRLYAIQ